MTKISDLLKCPITIDRAFIKLGVGVTGALFLSQIIDVDYRIKNHDEDKHVCKTAKEWEEETGMTMYEQKTARKKLKRLGVLEEKRKGVPAKMYYKLNIDRLQELMEDYE